MCLFYLCIPSLLYVAILLADCSDGTTMRLGPKAYGRFVSHLQTVTGNYCGRRYSAALDCHAACPGGTDSECPKRERCYAGITCPVAGGKYCGTSWEDAQTRCGVTCPNSVDSECPSGQQCYADVTCSGDPTTAPPTTTVTSTTTTTITISTVTTTQPTTSGGTLYCGTSWENAQTMCATTCPGGLDQECPTNQHCFADVNCATTSPPTTTTATTTTTLAATTTAVSTTTTTRRTERYCGTSWEDALASCGNTCPNGVDSECPAGQFCFADVTCNSGGTNPPTTTSTSASFVGYYELTWTASTPLTGANAGIAFSGWTNVASAVADSSSKYSTLLGTKYISLGGGNANGRWSASAINSVSQAISRGDLNSYAGVCFDIEEGDSGLASSFGNLFSAAKASGFIVLVTISHSSPYGFSDGPAVMETILSSTSVDYVSPQLYTTGMETSNDYTAIGYPWTSYAGRTPKIVVSITEDYLYAHAAQTFATYGVSLSGYIVWP